MHRDKPRIILRGARGVAPDPAPTTAAMPSFWLAAQRRIRRGARNVCAERLGNCAPAVDAATIGKTRRALIERSD
jgi:hypothetical protein